MATPPVLQLLLSVGLEYWNLCRRLRKEIHRPSKPGENEVHPDRKVNTPKEGPLTDAEILQARLFRAKMRGVPEKEIEDNIEAALMDHGATHWVDSGLPQIELGHKFAAALMCSNVSEELLRMVRRPWPGFMIILPNELLFMYGNHQGKMIPISRVLVFQLEQNKGDWSYIAWDKDLDMAIWRYGVPAEMLLPPDLDDSVNHMEDLITDDDRRTMTLIGRLIITTCASMMMKNMTKERNPDAHREYEKTGHFARNRNGEPQMRVFTVGKPINVDLRNRVKEFAQGTRTGKQLEVQKLVTGHMRLQWFGKGRKQSEMIWIEPYWRGPEDAPIAVGPHIMKGDDDETGEREGAEPRRTRSSTREDPGDPLQG